MGRFSMAGKEVKRVGRRFEILNEIICVGEINFFPVIKAGALQLFIGNRKSKRLYKEKTDAGDRTCARNISRILGNLRLKQNNFHYLTISASLLGSAMSAVDCGEIDTDSSWF